ncbi:MAG: glycosyltransferase family 2 protein [Firmicutes bacterium]|nr:glycosyltransferase family 2 protein [Bacillota bacterium]
MQLVDEIIRAIVYVYGIITLYKVAILLIGLFLPRKRFPKSEKQHRFAIMICARNEATVIKQLIDSLKKQDYPRELLSIFVCAHNCSDDTAKTAKEAGAVVFELNDNKHRKAYALDHMLKEIDREHGGISSFDGFFHFDADNVVDKNFVAEMNNVFAKPEFDMFTGMRCMKNFDDTIVSGYSAVQWYGIMGRRDRPYAILGLTMPINGTGMLIRSHILARGWRWMGISEDSEISLDMIARGVRGTYCQDAKLFDEQPVGLRILLRQKMRWARGNVVAYIKYLPHLILGLFAPYRQPKKSNSISTPPQKNSETGQKATLATTEQRLAFVSLDSEDLSEDVASQEGRTSSAAESEIKARRPWWKPPLSDVQKRFSVLDSLISFTPVWMLSFILAILYPIGAFIYWLAVPEHGLSPMVINFMFWFASFYLWHCLYNMVAIIRENGDIRLQPKYKTLIHFTLWPFVQLIIDFAQFFAVFWPVKWKPIPRKVYKTIEDVCAEPTLKDTIVK